MSSASKPSGYHCLGDRFGPRSRFGVGVAGAADGAGGRGGTGGTRLESDSGFVVVAGASSDTGHLGVELKIVFGPESPTADLGPRRLTPAEADPEDW